MKYDKLHETIQKELLPECLKILKGKGKAYSGTKDSLGNFKRAAETVNLPIETIWYVYYCKHQDAVSSFIRGEYGDTENISGRIMDMINYLFLFYCILKEKGKI